ncbi:hypothetical protein PIB30_107265 [Stylosanthes scabra]|uniref:Ubiquitin-like protease family profile domain-containing protein n=1 Tax=Stylosanthes scabra TaxID=79078 RepID=A0ABU6W0F5_9FABA|nr:hypothetical protein [Stylosanthes scabra]
MNVFGGFSGTPSPTRSSLTLGLILEPKPLKALPASPVENEIAPSDEELTDVDKDTIYDWVMRSSKNKQVLGESVAWYCVPFDIYLTRGDLLSLKSREWVNNNWFIPICDRDHWYLYALKIAKKKLWVLDSLHSEPFDDIRRKVDEYAGKIIHDMVKVAIPSFMHTIEGFECEYADVPKQPNKHDCGIFVILFMERWNEGSSLPSYNNDDLKAIRKDFAFRILFSPLNGLTPVLFTESGAARKRILQNRNKIKEVKTPFIAANTTEITRRAEKFVAEKAYQRRKKTSKK